MPSRVIENPLHGNRTTFLRTSRETRGERTEVEVEVEPGGGVGTHYHGLFDEEIECVEGVMEVGVGKEVLRLAPGDKAIARRGDLHYWRNPTDRRAVFRARLTPGHTGFENTLRLEYGMAADGTITPRGIPKSLTAVALLVTWSDTNAPGFFSMIRPLLDWRARRAEASGKADELRRRYDCELPVTGR